MRKQSLAGKLLVHIPMILLSCACLFPFLLVMSSSLTEEVSLTQYGFSIFPRKLSFEAYAYIFRAPQEIISAYKTTIFVTVFGTVVGTLVMAMIAYPISRPDYKYKNVISFFVYFTMLFSGGMVAEYLVVANVLGLKDTIWALIVPMLLNAWNIMLLRMFMRSIPFSLIEEANLEGASEFRIFFSIVLPLSKVGIVTIALFTALNLWNDWYQSMLYIDHGDVCSLQYMLYKIMNKVTMAQENISVGTTKEKLPNENLRMALCVVAAGPMLLVFPFFQKYFSKGIVVGSVKE